VGSFRDFLYDCGPEMAMVFAAYYLGKYGVPILLWGPIFGILIGMRGADRG
jgi:hypothetical protein